MAISLHLLPVRVENVVVLVHVDGLAVEGDGALEVPGLARRVALPHLQYSTVQYSTVQYSTARRVALPHLLQEQRLVGLARAAAAGPRIFALQSGG